MEGGRVEVVGLRGTGWCMKVPERNGDEEEELSLIERWTSRSQP